MAATSGIASSFRDLYQKFPRLVARAPGRVNLIGEHLDYNGGPVLPMAINLGTELALAPRSDGIIQLASKNYPSFRSDYQNLCGTLSAPSPRPWFAALAALLASLAEESPDGLELLDGGFDLLVHSDLPIGAGLSSSAAFSVAAALVFRAWLGRPPATAITTAQLCQRAEHLNGVNCGIMDPLASAAGLEGQALALRCDELSFEAIPFLPEPWTVLVIDSQVTRQLAHSGFNERRRHCEQALEHLRKSRPELARLGLATLQQVDGLSDPLLQKRARHVVSEELRVWQATEALRRADAQAFGALMTQSHESLRVDYEVSCPALDEIVAICLDSACAGARMTGAGFGGCAIALIRRDSLDELRAKLSAAGYSRHWALRPAKGAALLSL